MKCVICGRRPANGGAYCVNCADKIGADKRRKAGNQPVKFLTYQGHVVGLYPNGNGMLKAQLLRRKAEGLPKSKTLDLNRYIKGFSREQIKGFKACVLKLASA